MLIDCRFSDNLDDKFITDFINVENEVFNSNYTRNAFNKKYLNNIYGASVLAIVYIANHKPIAARALWRNDIAGQPAYQPGDTCVLEEARGNGVFSEMTKRAIEMLPTDTIIYNFPNKNSFPGYIKLGWKLVRESRLILLSSYRSFKSLNPIRMDKRYFEWWIKEREGVRYKKIFGKYFLVKKYPRPLSWKVISEVDKEIALQVPRLKSPALIFYSGVKETFYNKWFATGHIVAKTNKDVIIPSWKIDAI